MSIARRHESTYSIGVPGARRPISVGQLENVEGVQSATRASDIGHPHAHTMDGNYFGTICFGNNTVADDYNTMMRNGKMDPYKFLSIVQRCFLWASHVNINDSFATPLCHNINLDPWFSSSEAQRLAQLVMENTDVVPDFPIPAYMERALASDDLLPVQKYSLAYAVWLYGSQLSTRVHISFKRALATDIAWYLYVAEGCHAGDFESDFVITPAALADVLRMEKHTYGAREEMQRYADKVGWPVG